jgi:hypothetical protein
MQYEPWTTHQLAWLQENYPRASREDVERRLAPHSWGSIEQKAWDLGLRRRAEIRDWKAICAAHKPVFDFGRSSFK